MQNMSMICIDEKCKQFSELWEKRWYSPLNHWDEENSEPAITVSESVFRTYVNKNKTCFRKLEIVQNGNSSSTNTKPQINIINHTCSPLIFLYSLLQNYESSILMSCSWHMSYEQRITHKDNKTSKTLFNEMIIVPIAFSNV